MFLDQKDLKSNFLQKKNKQKKKIQQNQQQNNNSILIQKNIRAFIIRRKLEKQWNMEGNVLKLVFLKNDVNTVDVKKVQETATGLLEKVLSNPIEIEGQPLINYKFYLKKILFSALKSQKNSVLNSIAYKVLEKLILSKNYEFLQQIIKSPQFIQTLNSNLAKRIGVIKILNLTVEYLYKYDLIYSIDERNMFSLIIHEYSSKKMQEENNANNEEFKMQTLVILLNSFYKKGFVAEVNFSDFQPISKIVNKILKMNVFQLNANHIPLQPCLAFLIQILLRSIQSQHKQLLHQICLQYNNILVLMQDEQDILYFENKVMNHSKMQQFSQIVLKSMQSIFESDLIVKIFFDRKRQESKIIKQVMIKSIKMLGRMFQDRKIIFLRSLLSSNQLLLELLEKKNNQFYEGLKMRLLAMDDEEFKSFNLFTQNQWKSIIHEGINKSLEIIKKQMKNYNYNKKKPQPFQNKNEDNLILSGLSEMLESLYKKSLRTNKYNQEIFVSKQLSEAFYTFNFGTGALVMEKLLKLYPFAFTFESRLQKFKELIKEDKKNHDRSLFLQDQIDQDLIIHVRRGKEFLDAFQSLIHKDLRKKYKLVFFNQQGLEQQGIDGGGLIKQFINRVLKSAFSDVYGLFYQTQQNELMPNPYSPCVQQYEFIGKIIGKAVYESITIEQKFVQPFLNLVIGRKNSFQDIQYIEPQIYKSLVDIKKMQDEDLQDLQQTFIILDQLPKTKVQKYVNLLNPSKQVIGNQEVYVTRQNKLQFIMAYSDYKCNKQLQEKTRHFRKGFLKVMKPQWLTLFNNQQLNKIISGGQPNFDVTQLKMNCVYTDYNEKSLSIIYFWQIMSQFSAQQKAQFLLYVTSCSRPPTLGFSSMKPKICISRDQNPNHLPTANTCMNVFRLPDYKNKQMMRKKVLYAIYSKAGFEFA